jgi:hypothetical protein
MHRRFVVYALFATLAIGGIAFAADALVVSDVEQVEHIADVMTEGSDVDRADALSSWVDLTREEVIVSRGSETERYGERNDFALSETLTDGLSSLGEGEVDVIQRSVEVDGDRATIALRTRGAGELCDTTIELHRNGQGWLVSRVRIR